MDAKTEAVLARFIDITEPPLSARERSVAALAIGFYSAERALSPEGKEAEPVVVKPLVWREWPGSVSFTSETAFGEYVVEGGGSVWFVYPIGLEDPVGPAHPSVDVAKAAAQADYERRVLSCLASPPRADHEDEIRRLREALVRIIEAEEAFEREAGCRLVDAILDARKHARDLLAALATKRSDADG